MDVLQIVMPVLVMIILGMLCRKWKILTGEGVANMKVPGNECYAAGCYFSCIGNSRI